MTQKKWPNLRNWPKSKEMTIKWQDFDWKFVGRKTVKTDQTLTDPS